MYDSKKTSLWKKIIILVVVVSALFTIIVVPSSADTFTNVNPNSALDIQYCGLPLTLVIGRADEAYPNRSLVISDYGGIPYVPGETATNSINTSRIWTLPNTNNLDPENIPDTYYKSFESRYVEFTPSGNGAWYRNPLDFTLYGSVMSSIDLQVRDYYLSLDIDEPTDDASLTSYVNATEPVREYYESLLPSRDDVVAGEKIYTSELGFGQKATLNYDGILIPHIISSQDNFKRLFPSLMYFSIPTISREAFDTGDAEFVFRIEFELYDANTDRKRVAIGAADSRVLSPSEPGVPPIYYDEHFVAIDGMGGNYGQYVISPVLESLYGFEITHFSVDMYRMFTECYSDIEFNTGEFISGISIWWYITQRDVEGVVLPLGSDVLPYDASNDTAQFAIKSLNLEYDDCYGDSVSLASAELFENLEYSFSPVYLGDFNLTSWLGNTLGGVMNVSIIGNITLAHILIVAFGVMFVVLVLKFFAGG